MQPPNSPQNPTTSVYAVGTQLAAIENRPGGKGRKTNNLTLSMQPATAFTSHCWTDTEEEEEGGGGKEEEEIVPALLGFPQYNEAVDDDDEGEEEEDGDENDDEGDDVDDDEKGRGQ